MKTVATRFSALVCLALAFSQTASAELIYGVANNGGSSSLLTWDSASPTNVISSTFLDFSANTQDDAIVSIDVRPSTGQLWGLGASGRPYIINPVNGVANDIVPFAPGLNGLNFGFDFNPVIDRIRATAETNMNRVYNPNTGQTETIGTNLSYGPADPNFGVDPNVVHSAYSNNFFLATSTQLYGIDTGLDILATQANNAGTLGTIGPLGVNVGAVGGFDISGNTGIAYATLLPANSSVSQFYTINLLTGAATSLGQIDGGVIITAMTVANPGIPEPSTLALAGLSMLGCVVARRKAA